MGRRLSTVLAAVVMVAVSGGGAFFAAAPATAQGCTPRLVVSKTVGLAASGETVTVTGSCFDVAKGVYVAFCVVPPAGSVPSPCGGGVDMSGANGLSHWISSNPPPQGVGLTTPYGPGGTFTVTMRPAARLNATVDCLSVRCAVVTRNDHTRSSDRSQDVIVPVTFVADPAPVPPAPAPPTTPAPLPSPPAEASATPPPDAGSPSPAEETTGTTASDVPTTSTTAAGDGVAAGPDELAVAPVSADGGGGPGGSGVVVAGVALLALVLGGGGWAVRRRRSATADGSEP